MIFVVAMFTNHVVSVEAQQLDRTILPIPQPKRPVYKELDVRNVKMPPHFEVKAPKGAPNVVIILIDYLRFGATSTFGGPITSPHSSLFPRTNPCLLSIFQTVPRSQHEKT